MKEIMTLELPNVLVMKLVGETTSNQAEEIYDRMDQLRIDLDKVNLLDPAEVKNTPPEAREALTKLPLTLPWKNLAVFGVSARIRVLGTPILKITRIGEPRFFGAEAQVRTWLGKKHRRKRERTRNL